jgi:hypothetical protein
MRPQVSIEIAPCPAEACLREWVAAWRTPAADDDAREARRTATNEIEARCSQAIARSDVGAAFQLLIAATSWAWRHGDPDEPKNIPDVVFDSLTDGVDFQRRLMLGAYFHLTRDWADKDLRDAERIATSEHILGGGIMQWLRDSQSTVDFRRAL